MSEIALFFNSVAALLSTLFGVGMYFTPKAFAYSGIKYGLGQLLFVGFISFLSIFSLFKISLERTKNQLEQQKIEEGVLMNTYAINIDEKKDDQEEEVKQENNVTKLSYSGLDNTKKGLIGRFIDIMIMITSFSTVLFFHKFISLISANLLGQSVQDSIGFNPYILFVIAYAIIIWLGGQIRNLQDLSWLSKISLGSIATNCIVVGIMNFFLVEYRDTHVERENKFLSLDVISTFIFAMSCQVNVVEIFNDMRGKSAKYLACVAGVASLGACFFYGIMGIAGNALFGDYMLNEDIINILSKEDSHIVKYLSDTNSILYYVHFIVPCFAIIGILIGSIYQLSAVTRSLNTKWPFKKIQSKTKKQAVITFSIICLITFINMFPQIGLTLVFDIIGQFMCNPLAYFFPFLFLLTKYHKSKDYGIKFFGSLIFIIGSVSFAFGGFIYPRVFSDLTSKNSFNMTTTEVPNITLFN